MQMHFSLSLTSPCVNAHHNLKTQIHESYSAAIVVVDQQLWKCIAYRLEV